MNSCWSKTSSGVTGTTAWNANSNATCSSSTGPNAARTGSKYFYLETSWSSGGVGELTSPEIDLSTLARPKLDFYTHMYGSNIGSLEVEIYDGSTWTNVLTASGQQQSNSSAPWTKRTIDLASFIGDTIQIKFIGYRSTSYRGDIAIDDISVYEGPTCIDGSGIAGYNPTQTSHDITWTPGSFDVSWEVEYGAPGYVNGSGTTVPSSNDSTTISGLISNTRYDVYFRGICSAGDTGAYIGPLSITTPAFPIVYDTTYPSNCYSYTTPLGGVNHTTSGLYFDTVKGTTPHVYDSAIHVYSATVNPLNTGLQIISICDSLVAGSGKALKATGIYLDTMTNSFGCDSIMTIDLTITSTTYILDSVFACDSNNFRGRNLTTAGTYYDTSFASSCDSVFIRTLTMGYASLASFTHFVCDSFVSPSGKVWKTNGTYLDTLTNASGCDSNMTFNLTFGYISYAIHTPTACDLYTSPSGKRWTRTGTYLDTIVNASGCDSAMTFNLIVNYSRTRTDNIALCAGTPHRVGPYLYRSAGTYTNVFATVHGCDSTIITNLTYFAPATASLNYNFCTGDSVSVLGNWYYAATTVIDTIVGGSSNGCDSITTHNITTRTVSPALNLGSDVVSCADGGATVYASTAYDTYNWSSGGTTPVLSVTGALASVGTTNHVLTVTQASSGCTASDDINITFNSCVGLREVDADLNVAIYPNPATNFVTIEIFDKYNEGNLKLEILNSIGQVVSSRNISNSSEKVIMDVNNFSKGMYLVRISSDKLYMTKKLIIQK